MSETLDLPVIDEALIDKKPVAAAAAVVVQQSTQLDLTKLDLTDVALAQFGDWRTDIAAAKKRHAGIVWDLSTAKGMADIKSFRQRECNTPQAEANKVGDALVSKLTQVSKKVRAEQALKVKAYKELAAPLTKLIDERQAEIDAEEIRLAQEAEAKRKAEEARLQGLREQVDALLAKWVAQCHVEGITSERIANGVRVLELTEPKPEWADVADHWRTKKADTLREMERLKVERVATEQARVAAELEEQRRQMAEQAEVLRREREEIEAARARAEAPAATATAAATEGKAENPEPGTLEAAPNDPHETSRAKWLAEVLTPADDKPYVRIAPIPITQDAQESGFSPADAPACTSSGAEAAEALPSGSEGTGAHAEERAPEPALWGVHVEGPDDIEASPSKEDAQIRADSLNQWATEKRLADVCIQFNAKVVPWPFTPEAHTEDLRKLGHETLTVDPDPAEAERMQSVRVILAGPEEPDDEGGIDATELRDRAMELVKLVRQAKTRSTTFSHQWWADLIAAGEALAVACGEGA